MLLVAIDWAERHHDVCVMAADGSVLATERIADGVAGVARLHDLIAGHASDPAEVVVGIETDRGLLVGALVAAGYQVVAVNPLAASRYRERHTISRAKSDRGDARMLADLVRTDRRRVGGADGASCPEAQPSGRKMVASVRSPPKAAQEPTCFGGDGCAVTRQVSEPALAYGDELQNPTGAGDGVGEHRRSRRPGHPRPWNAC